mmetsp:Transcript_64886/g.95027  ORF Transcript_64886/g.95027 Transcript_64886/m.95027 type:complete len:85 (-) Transcript_64886:1249-1503(-)
MCNEYNLNKIAQSYRTCCRLSQDGNTANPKKKLFRITVLTVEGWWTPNQEPTPTGACTYTPAIGHTVVDTYMCVHEGRVVFPKR